MSSNICFGIPYYRGRNYLRRALESVIAQSHPGWVARVIDDSGSDDESQFILTVLGNLNDPRISYQKNDGNKGIGYSWNRCFEYCEDQKIPYLNILHEDDLLKADYAKEIIAAFERSPELSMIVPQVEVINDKEDLTMPLRDRYRLWVRPPAVKRAVKRAAKKALQNTLEQNKILTLASDEGLANILLRNYFYCPAIAYQIRNISPLRFREDLKSALDLEFYIRLLYADKKIGVLASKPLFSYRRHSGSTTEKLSANSEKFDEELSIFRWAAEESKKRGWKRSSRAAQMRPSYRLHRLYRFVKTVF